MIGTTETKEAIVGINELILVVAVLLKDGFQPGSDMTSFVTKLVSDSNFRSVLMKAQDGANKIPAEMKDLDLMEGIELAKLQIEYIPKIVSVLKKDAA